MKICAISDMHGQYDFNIDECDVLCICGDIVPLEIQRPPNPKPYDLRKVPPMDVIYYGMINEEAEKAYQRWRVNNINWLSDTFIPWCEKQPCKHVFVIGGNHDFIFEKEGKQWSKEMFENTKITYLEDEVIEFDGKKFYGSPWCHEFGPWAFMRNDYSLASKFRQIGEDIDVLMTHDAPYGRDDLLLESEWHIMKGHIGNKPMVRRLSKLKNPPKFHFTGHLHSCNHLPTEYDGTTTVCVSLLDERYYMKYKPFYISI